MVDPAVMQEFARMMAAAVVDALQQRGMHAGPAQPNIPGQRPPQQPTPVTVMRINHVTGQPEVRVTTLACQIAEMNDNLIVLNNTLSEFLEDMDEEPRRRRRRAT